MTWFDKLLGSTQSSTLIDSAFVEVTRMLEQSKTMFQLATRALLHGEPLEKDLDKLDDVVDEGERLVRRMVLEHLSVQPRQGLVPSLVLVSMIQDCERVGDFARGLGELLPLARSPLSGPFRDRLVAASNRLFPMFDHTIASFRADDPKGAQSVIDEASSLKEEFQTLVTDVAASNLSADLAVVYSGAARIFRRIGAHLSNVCSTVVQPYHRIRHEDESA